MSQDEELKPILSRWRVDMFHMLANFISDAEKQRFELDAK